MPSATHLSALLPWFLQGISLVILALVWRHLRSLQRRHRELASMVREQTASLQAALEEAKAANRTKDDFLATMSHEIRTPLHAVLGMLTCLQDTALSRDQSEFTQSARQAATNLLGIIDDILDYSRIQAGKVSLQPRPFDLAALAEDLADLMAGSLADKPVELVLLLQPHQRRIYQGDEDRLRQVLLNLLGNALKFTNRGSICLEIQVRQATSHDDRVEIRVTDTGPGIPREHQPLLFERFQQGDSSVGRQYGGTGLGLAISRRLVELMGGTIGLESEPGQGSCFWIQLSLPVVRETPSRLLNTARWPGLRVFIVDHEPLVHRALGTHFGRWGVTFDGATTLESACPQLLEAHRLERPFALVLVRSSGVSDMDCPILPPCLRVLMAPMNQVIDPAEVQARGWDGVLRKPITTLDLEELLDRAWMALHDENQASWLTSAETTREFVVPFAPGFPPLSGRHLLVVEDNALNRAVARQLLSQAGATFDEAEDGREGVALATQRRYDAILMDVQMPGMDGIQATQAIRKSEMVGHVPIIGMSAHVQPGAIQQFRVAGMDEVLTKPFHREDLLRVLMPLLPERPMPAVRPPALDPAGLEASFLRDGNLDETGLQEVLLLFLEHSPGFLEKIRQSMSILDWPGLRGAAHRLAGSAAYVHASTLLQSCRDLEEAALTRQAEGLEARVQEIEAETRSCLDQAKRRLETLRNPLPAP